MSKRNDKWCGDCTFINIDAGNCRKYKIKNCFHAIKMGSLSDRFDNHYEIGRCGQCLVDGRPHGKVVPFKKPISVTPGGGR